MTALEFLNIVQKEHDRDSCSDENTNNGFYSRGLDMKDWQGRCRRCLALEIIKGENPKGIDLSDQIF